MSTTVSVFDPSCSVVSVIDLTPSGCFHVQTGGGGANVTRHTVVYFSLMVHEHTRLRMNRAEEKKYRN